jgi:Polyketide cyclase / dehydrase and lipid transport
MSTIEKSIVARAKPETIFAIYKDVANWNTWDPDTKACQVSNGLTLGSVGSLTPAKGNTVPLEITAVAENRHFTATSKTALFCMTFEHILEPVESGTRIIHRVTFAGFLRPLLVMIVGRQVEKGLPITLQNLKKMAEQNEGG